MSRPLRIEYEGAVYHITARGNDKRQIFNDKNDREIFTQKLKQEVERYGIRLYAYVLMGNHYHLLLETPDANLSEFMHRLQSSYTNYSNRRHGRVGHLFQGRYKALVADGENYFLALARYIHLNPVRAGLAEKPGHWRWSSYHEYVRPRRTEKWIDRTVLLRYFSPRAGEAISRFAIWTESGIGREDDKKLISNTRRQVALGGDDFIESINLLMAEKKINQPQEIPALRSLRKWNDKDADNAIKTIADYFDISAEQLATRDRKNNLPRDIAVYMFQRHSRWTLRETGDRFGIGYNATGKAARRISVAIDKDKSLLKIVTNLNYKLQT